MDEAGGPVHGPPRVFHEGLILHQDAFQAIDRQLRGLAHVTYGADITEVLEALSSFVQGPFCFMKVIQELEILPFGYPGDPITAVQGEGNKRKR